MEDDVKKAKKLFKQAWDALNDFFDEKRSDEVIEKDKDARKGKVALAKFHKGLIGKTDQINFRILIGKDKELGDHIYEAVYKSDKKEPYIYDFDVKKGRPIKTVLTNFKEDDWNGYKKVKKYKSLTKFLEQSYKNGIYYNGKKYKKVDALKVLINGLKRSLEAVGEDVKEKKGVNHEQAKKIAKIVAISVATIAISAALIPAAGVLAAELLGGGEITGAVLGQAGQAATEGLQGLADPTEIARRIAAKVVTKGKSLKG